MVTSRWLKVLRWATATAQGYSPATSTRSPRTGGPQRRSAPGGRPVWRPPRLPRGAPCGRGEEVGEARVVAQAHAGGYGIGKRQAAAAGAGLHARTDAVVAAALSALAFVGRR